jgi:hypothetical protein
LPPRKAVIRMVITTIPRLVRYSQIVVIIVSRIHIHALVKGLMQIATKIHRRSILIACARLGAVLMPVDALIAADHNG